MTAASSRRALRAFAVTTAALGAVLVSGAGAFADSSPSPAVTLGPVENGKKCTPQPVSKDRATVKTDRVFCLATGADGKPVRIEFMPRGGVAAGERPVTAQDGGNPTTVIVGATAAALTLAAAGTVVIRRRAAQHDAR
ncbi:hypothetical protein ACWDR0_05150 [Streptomyces sp. NPDC003691]